MSRRRGSAIALNASDVVVARGTTTIIFPYRNMSSAALDDARRKPFHLRSRSELRRTSPKPSAKAGALLYAALFVSERLGRIHARGAAGRHVGGGERDGEDDRRDPREGDEIDAAALGAVAERGRHQAVGAKTREQADDQAGDGEQHALTQHHAHDVGSARA